MTSGTAFCNHTDHFFETEEDKMAYEREYGTDAWVIIEETKARIAELEAEVARLRALLHLSDGEGGEQENDSSPDKGE